MRHSRFLFILVFFIFCISMYSCNNAGSDTDTATEGDTTGVTDTEITIGSWGPMTGPAALWGNILKGMDAYFKMINEEGGIHGRQIKFVFKDDGYDPSKTVPAVRELVQRDEIFAAAGGIGTATNMAVTGFLEENKVPWVSPMTGATYWSYPVKENIYTSFPLYFDEGQIMANMVIDELEITKVGIIYQNDDFGKSGLVGVQSILEQNDLDFVAALPVEPTDTDLSSHIARLQEAGAEAVFLWVLPRQAAIALGTAAVVKYQPKWLASLVLSDLTLMHQITKGAWEGVYFTYPGAILFNDESNELMMKYRDAFAKHYPDDRWSVFASGGFLWAEPLIEGLRRAGKDLSRESFLEAMTSIQNYTGAAGVPVSFSENNHLGTRSMYVMRCVSATEAERVSDMITGSADIAELEKKLHGN